MDGESPVRRGREGYDPRLEYLENVIRQISFPPSGEFIGERSPPPRYIIPVVWGG